MTASHLTENGLPILFATWLITGIVGLVCQWQYSGYAKLQHGIKMPKITSNNTMKGWAIFGVMLLFPLRSAPAKLKFLVFILRFLTILCFAEIIFFAAMSWPGRF